MFEVGFTEIILILGLALLVLGPEKLPKLAAQIGRWTGRARSMARQLRAQLDQEVNFQEQRTAHGSGQSKPRTETPPPAASVPDEPVAAPHADDITAMSPDVPVSDPALKPGNE